MGRNRKKKGDDSKDPPTDAVPDQGPPAPERQIANKTGRDQWALRLRTELRENEAVYLPLLSTAYQGETDLLLYHIASFISLYSHLLPPALPDNYFKWLFGAISRAPASALPPSFREALTARARHVKVVRSARRCLARKLFLYKEPTCYLAFQRTATTIQVARLAIAYPPAGWHVAEDPELHQMWSTYLANCEQPDKRKPRRPVHLLDTSKLQKDIPAELNCILRDRKTDELVAVVVRNFSGNEELLRWAKTVITEAVTTRKSVRLEDPGEIVIGGYSAGSLSKASFGFAKNLLRKQDLDAAAEAQTAIATLLTIFWLFSRGVMPAEVIEDFQNYYRENNIPRFDPNWPFIGNTGRGDLQLPLELGSFKFKDVELAPGSAMLVQRYARAVHKEHQGHKWGLAWSTLKAGSDVRGGNFFLASFGVRIILTQDTAFAWKPEDYHTSSLGSYEPTFDVAELEDPRYNQQGVTFVTSGRLASTYAKWAAAQVPGKEKIIGFAADMTSNLKNDDCKYD
ncbi:hypothetical protein DFP72DRAFT_184327 [Ephemerocybe angulata]|uniref:Uncharacterized protein n=1 Tax=Ephemerocybe angulata TaxID=980116 RepID=A0A8H6HA65_9AGAR|nr:hypothetical protein DFP72DRAFT_184327 [Tulosesus angulatus]